MSIFRSVVPSSLLVLWCGLMAGWVFHSASSEEIHHGTLDPSRHHHHDDHHLRSEYLGFFRDSIQNIHINPFPQSVDGSGWPEGFVAVSMAGQRRLDNYATAVATVIHDNITGDIIETGVWRGGASMVASKTVELLDEASKRRVFFCDSFKGIPPAPNDGHSTQGDKDAYKLSILNDNSVERVMATARSFGVNMAHVSFVVGYFNESLPKLLADQPNLKFAVVRLDGDTYFSTMDAITVLYPRLQNGGFIIIDDYADWLGCKQAVDDYRRQHGILEPVTIVPHKHGESFRGAFWRKNVADSTHPYCPGATPGLRPSGSYNPSKLVSAPVHDCWQGAIHLPMCREFAKDDLRMCV